MASHDLASTSGGNFCEEEKSLAPPLFEGTNYKGWKILIEKFIKSLDIEVWNLAIARPANESNKKELQLNAKAKHYLFCGLSNEIFKSVYCFSSAYKVWNFLEEMYDSPPAGMEQSQEPENTQACTSLQECPSHDESIKCTPNEREEEILFLEEECQEDDNGTLCSNPPSSKSNVKNSNPIFCTSISSLQLLQTTMRKIKKLKNANCKLRLENKNLKAKVKEVSKSDLSNVTSIENTKPCLDCNDIKEKCKELEKELIFIKEQNEKLCLENSSLINDCAKCKEYKIEIQEMDETFDEYRDEYEKHIESIATTLKNSTIAYNKARHNLKTKNDELNAKIILLKEIIKKNNQNIHSQYQDISKSKININSQNINKLNNGYKRHQYFKNELPKNNHYYYVQHQSSPNIKFHKFPSNNTFYNHYNPKNYHNGNLTQKINTKPQFEWRPKMRNETLTPLKMGHSLSSPQKQTRSIWVPKGTVTPGPLWIPKSLIQ